MVDISSTWSSSFSAPWTLHYLVIIKVLSTYWDRRSFVRDEFKVKRIFPTYIPTAAQPADIVTKALGQS